jgi:hypothetical protein
MGEVRVDDEVRATLVQIHDRLDCTEEHIARMSKFGAQIL